MSNPSVTHRTALFVTQVIVSANGITSFVPSEATYVPPLVSGTAPVGTNTKAPLNPVGIFTVVILVVPVIL